MEVEGPYALLSWDAFAKLNTLIHFYSASYDDQVDFYCKILNPKGVQIVPCSEIDDTMNTFFGGHFPSTYKDSDDESDKDEGMDDQISEMLTKMTTRKGRKSKSPPMKLFTKKVKTPPKKDVDERCSGCKNFSETVKRQMIAHNCVKPNGSLEIEKFRKCLLEGRNFAANGRGIDLMPFQEAVS